MDPGAGPRENREAGQNRGRGGRGQWVNRGRGGGGNRPHNNRGGIAGRGGGVGANNIGQNNNNRPARVELNFRGGNRGGEGNRRPRARGHRGGGQGQAGRDEAPYDRNQSNVNEANPRNNEETQRGSTETPTALALNVTILTDLLTRSPEDVIMTLVNSHSTDWADAFKALKLGDDSLCLIIRILGEKVCFDFDESGIHSVDPAVEAGQVSLLMAIALPNFSKHLQGYCQRLHWQAKEAKNSTSALSESSGEDAFHLRIVEGLYTFYNFLFVRLPSASVDFLKKLLPEAIKLLTVISSSDPTSNANLTRLKKELEELQNIVSPPVIAKAPVEKPKNAPGQKATSSTPAAAEGTAAPDIAVPVHRNHFAFTPADEEQLHKMDPPENFREIPIFPTIDELLNPDDSFLRPNRKTGAYRDADHYLDVQFRLFREDFLRPIKNGVQEFVNNRHDYISGRKRMPWGTVRMYLNVRVTNVELVRETTVFSLQLSPELYKKVKWNKSRRLMNGSLLIITADLFKTGYFATVCQRSDEILAEEGIIGIAFEGQTPSLEILNQGFLMFESECYFEAYRHTLKVLQQVDLGAFPLAKFIVKSSLDVKPPKYLAHAQELMQIGGDYISPLSQTWPSANELKMDDTQHTAFKEALTKEISIIQGPPGCGKTFIGLKIMEALLVNHGLWWNNENEGQTRGQGAPILVVCLTNHTLDQFLEGILKQLRELFPNENPALIRVGGRTQSEELQEVSLQRKRMAASKMYLHSHSFRQRKSAVTRLVREIEVERRDLISEGLQLADVKGIVDFRALCVWNELRDFCSDELWTCLRDPKRFGLSVEDQTILAEERIRREFRTRQRSQRPAQAQAPVMLNFEDDEEYDADDLPRHLRGNDEPEFVPLNKNKNNKNKSEPAPKSLSYVQGLSLKDLQNTIRENQAEMNRSRGNYDQPAGRRNANLAHFEERIENAKFQQDFLDKVFTGFQEGTIIVQNNIDPARARPFSQTLSISQIWDLYRTVIERARRITDHNSTIMEQRLVEAQKELQNIYREGDGFLLASTKVVGMTTTGASKNGDLLQMMRSKIVIVEEAAEVLEAHIINCITEHCQQLIMIGDHQQLRPNIAVFELERKYNLNISLFERMVNNNLSCHRLLVQHRMRPEISDLVRGTIYKELLDHPSVQKFPSISGIEKSLYFITHTQMEKADGDSVTKTNIFEVKFLAALCQYLVLQGYSTSRITILVTYTGQMYLLRKEVENQANCKGVRVCAVDNFQGEENDIILLSMVRSNADNNIGFLKTDNRICVALSRAKHGLFIIGNMTNLMASSATWAKIKSKLDLRGEFGASLPLCCSVHGTKTLVRTGADFSKVPEGGCTLLCGSTLSCGHKCKAVCHVKNLEKLHKETKCLQPCSRACVRGHQCKGKCFDPCQTCTVQVEQKLTCGHSSQVKCRDLNLAANCWEKVEKRLTCGHSAEMKCHEDPRKYICPVPVDKYLNCGHMMKSIACHIKPSTLGCLKVVMKKNVFCGHPMEALCSLNPDYARFICKAVVTKKFSLCGHELEIKCFESDGTQVCRSKCTRRLHCGHSCTRFCHMNDDPTHAFSNCLKPCRRVCQNGHRCEEEHPCYTACLPCNKPVEKQFKCKSHKIFVKCSVDISNQSCRSKCERLIPGCGHPCQKLCFEACGPCVKPVEKMASCGHLQSVACSVPPRSVNCISLVKAPTSGLSTCGHFTMVPCSLRETITREESRKYCKTPCKYVFEEKDGGCGHACKGNCSECYEGRIHKKCAEECGRTLVCGHVCTFPCSSVCPPCTKCCDMRCDHSICGSKCGEPCSDCLEKCTWKCRHQFCTRLCKEPCDRGPCEVPCPLKNKKCGHPCIGFCGEPCPPQCRICDQTELTDFMLYGNESDPDARFVYLRDCGHSIEVEGMDHYMGIEMEKGAIASKSCPRCRTLIRHSKRYGTILRAQIAEVTKVKQVIFGNAKVVGERQSKLLSEIHGSTVWETHLVAVQKYIVEHLATVEKRQMFLFIELAKAKISEKKIDENTFASIEVIAKHGKEAITALTDSRITKFNLKDQLKVQYDQMFKIIIGRSLPLSSTEIKDFDREFERLFDLQQLFVRGSKIQAGNTLAGPIFERALQTINSSSIYNSTLKSNVHRFIKDLDDRLRTGLGISEREKQTILQAMGMRQGHWYKCPNGHIYVITECGGAMAEGKCNECGARIGGGQHRLRGDNNLASEMDGATAPSWPTNIMRP